MKKREFQRSPSIPSARIDVLEKGSRPRRSDYQCILGSDLKINPQALSHYCLTELDPLVDDLVLLAGAVAYADRLVPRRPSVAWRRELELVIPVNRLDRWQDQELLQHLIATLDLLTGDSWSILFKARRHKTTLKPQAKLPLMSDAPRVMSYSDGLDSFAVARLTEARQPNTPLILVTTGGRRKYSHSESRPGKSLYRVSIPFSLCKNAKTRLREPSFRSRGLVFGVMAGIAANLLKADRIVVPESGQGTFGPSMMPVGNEAVDVRTHPVFTNRLSTLFRLVFGTVVRHEHPQMWKTKGETLAELRPATTPHEWWRTVSCPRDARHVSIDNHRLQCGVCASCLLRRQSVFAAGLDEEHEQFLWSDLSATTLEDAAIRGARATTQNDQNQARCGVVELQEFADLLKDPRQVEVAAYDLARGIGEDPGTIKQKLVRLIGVHSSEWSNFISNINSRSFIHQWLEIIK